jgi:hypothetical protein
MNIRCPVIKRSQYLLLTWKRSSTRKSTEVIRTVRRRKAGYASILRSLKSFST